ncbi:DUF192 domain-containing protein [Roseibium sp. Sym1]|uniref:DUF192 domain-containing protein n=1 Tax=Roseibium sp. Sym1 TaxID=3016006 RepID=UPI0022B2F084|nr:DUF192 domain-containing protein [Roseibium sp. Sym1]
MTSRFFRKGLLGLAAVVIMAFSGVVAQAQAPQSGLPVEELVVTSGDGEHRFQVDVAATDSQRSYGLMFRQEMAADQGMLFLFEGEGERYFWMKNTPLPLDIIYIGANGEIVSIAADTEPFSLDAIPSGGPAKYVLEVNAGIAKKLDIKAGDTVASPSITGD